MKYFDPVKYFFTISAFLLAFGNVYAASDAKINPYLQPNNTFISISGKVEDVAPDHFTLDYGSGKVIVEMDVISGDAAGYNLVEGYKVIVNGMIDDDFYETTKIEASSVYVDKLNKYFYASSVDDEDYRFFNQYYSSSFVIGETAVEGYVTDVSDDEFTVNTGNRSVIVDVASLPYDPLDDTGYQQVDVGDTVRAFGIIQNTIFTDKRLIADSIITLWDS